MIYKHNYLELPLHLGLSGIYIIVKYTISPVLYALKSMGFRSSLPTRLDSSINKFALPLTERADSNVRLDVKPRLQKGDKLPSVSIYFRDGKTCLLNEYVNSPLLLIFVRGSWCSYSRLHLANIMASKERFENAGIKLLAITGYNDQEWWNAKGIDIPMVVDQEGEVFNYFGLHIDSWMEYSWGRNLPHESVFLFNKDGILVFSDVRKVSGILPGQRFLGSDAILEHANNLL